MRISIKRSTILPAVSVIGNIVEKRQTLPILSNMLFKVSENLLSITATDLEVEMTTAVVIDTNSEGEVTIPARKFVDICKALPEDANIEIVTESEKAYIRSGKSKFTLGVLPAADYPSIDISEIDYTFEIVERDLKEMIDKTSFSMAHQDVRYYLNGMLVELERDKVKTVSTDGHRLALCEKVVDNGSSEYRNFLLPRKAVLAMARLLENTNNRVSIEISKNLARFCLNNTIFTTKLIDGKFPDYERVIPKNCDKTAIVDKELFKNALIRASILSSDKYKGIRITVGNSLLKLQAHNPEQEEAEEEFDIEYMHDSVTIGFNVGYLLDILGAVNSNYITIDFLDTNSSSVISVPGENETLYVVMPMRL